MIGVVPSEGSKSFQGKLIAIDTKRDLALIEFTGTKLPPLALFNGAVTDGEALIALGYPGNVDVATARSAADFITPQSPVRSQGGFAGTRTLEGISVLLHTRTSRAAIRAGPCSTPAAGCSRQFGDHQCGGKAMQPSPSPFPMRS